MLLQEIELDLSEVMSDPELKIQPEGLSAAEQE